ncbi:MULTISPECIES: hypothetical protein [Comamonadaceae]|uniref:hypothetical protein n=1 Tax=Comamonadaceae TaxID=80864 RepID=UPI0011A72CD1|nr:MULTISPECIES: hypothetical protein [Comamonadaceae]
MGELEQAVWSPTKLKPTDSRIGPGTKVVAYCCGVFLLPDDKTLCVLVGRSKPLVPDAWISSTLKASADALLLEHQTKVAEFDDAISRKRQDNEDFYGRHSAMKKFEGFAQAQLAMKSQFQRPVVTAERLRTFMLRAVKFPQPTSGDTEKLARSAISAVAASGWPPSRDGNYAGILPGTAGHRAQGLVSWAPHSGLPSYPEVRWAVQRRLPAALRKPRSEQIGSPNFDTGAQPVEDSVQVQGFVPEANDLKDSLDDLQLDQIGDRDRVDGVRSDLKGQGFEAIAWFQPYHVWTEETWGIYFDARKLDDLALSFLDDFKSENVNGSHSLAALLAFGLTYAHELFHARVEAALSWLEINAQQPRHLRYQDRVYQALRETPDWLEEALANWSAWDWFKAPSIRSLVTRMASNIEGLDRVVEGALDLAPPGYREWRLGHHAATWRTFANQLSTANPKINSTSIGLPLESALTGPLPYDFQHADIPLRFVGSGVIADRLQSHPSTFNVPPRRELERALKRFHHSLDASGGKGGHQKWTGPDQRAFILPTRDPVSPGVFKTFLHHVGIDKATYVRQVRPNL